MSKALRIGVFAYNFPHQKTQEGLLGLFVNGISMECILAQDWRALKVRRSAKRIAPRGLKFSEPRLVAESLGIPFHVVDHDGAACVDLIGEYNLDLGVVLGARILPKTVIDAFSVGILNIHPGALPENRGLDAIKWAVIKGERQVVTAHLIDESIDRGRLVLAEEVEVYTDDSLLDLHVRVMNRQFVVMERAIRRLQDDRVDLHSIGTGKYRGPVPPDLEISLDKTFLEYRARIGIST